LIASLVALATAIGVIMWKINLFGSPPTSSIAVLPFENLSNDREDASFADGLQDDLLTKLASIADLKVISRTSVMRYRGSWDTHQIGKLLGVSFVLEGSVRKTGAWVHINAQLIDAQTDAHVWAKQYDGDLKDLFAIQTEIAKDVAEQLRVKISHAEKEAIERPPTTDLTAFDLYSRAKSLLLMTSFGNRDKGNLLQAADLLSEAIAHDPSYFQAYCELAYAHDLLYLFGNDHTPRRLALAEAAIRSAYRLRPDAAEVHLARAENLYRGHLDYDRALSELELARKASANDPRLFELKGYIQRRQGKQEEALCNLKRAVDLDPRNVVTLQQMAISYRALRRYAEAILVLNRILNIVPDDLDTKKERAGVEFEWHADIQPLRRLVDSTRATDPSAVPAVADGWLICALAERDAIAAEEALAALGEAPLNDGVVQLHRSFLEGLIARMKNDSVRARAAFMSARAEQEKVVRAQPDYSPPLCVLGLIDAALGNKEEALREGARAMELLPVEKDSVDGVLMIAYSAVIAAWTGNKELACEELARATRIPGGVTYGQLKLLPFWDPLRGDPCFENIVASLAPRAPTQATKLKFPVN
jgi:TolB-like protein/Tfp pilus assembly protein PilF